jgi:hypothetical protein
MPRADITLYGSVASRSFIVRCYRWFRVGDHDSAHQRTADPGA